MEYITVGNTTYVASFEGSFFELSELLDTYLLNTLEVLGVTKIVWGEEGQHWEKLENFPRT